MSSTRHTETNRGPGMTGSRYPVPIAVWFFLSALGGTVYANEESTIEICNPAWDVAQLRVTLGTHPNCDDNEEVFAGDLDRGQCVRVTCLRNQHQRVCRRGKISDGGWEGWKHSACAFDRNYDL